MKKLYLEIFLFFCVFLITYFMLVNKNEHSSAEVSKTVSLTPKSDNSVYIYSEHMLLIQLKDKRILSEIQSDKSIYPASLTKIMTAIVALENTLNWEHTFIVPEEIFEPLKKAQASMAGFIAGEKVPIKDLLYGTLLSSGADGALTLAYGIAGGEKSFVDLMNKKALELGMFQTHFTNVTGLHDDNHVSTLNDLALLVEYALENPYFYKIFTTQEYTCEPTNIHSKGLKLESTLFSKIEGESMIIGGKTGYTPEAGLCLATMAQIDNTFYVLLTANAPGNNSVTAYHIADAMRIFNALKTRACIE